MQSSSLLNPDIMSFNMQREASGSLKCFVILRFSDLCTCIASPTEHEKQTGE